jgi:(1->4)-alpha-D-glucan 1-alpha-D-glucosylmutase
MKCQQLTGPVMAKGVEDTSYYIYNRLISLNEVGGEPQEFGLTLEHFHRHNRDRLQHWPHSMLTLSTHDTKRGEDARARINALSEDAPAWRAALLRWTKLNEAKKTAVDGAPAPDRNDEYLFYQTLVGAWPGGSVTGEDLTEFRRRIAAYMQKAIKEAKVHTSWINPNEAYDSAVAGFVEQVLGVVSGAEFINDLSQFHGRVAYIGMINSLAQTLLKLSVPGVPDFYQGTELWDFSLVDPDNRRPVDFTKRQRVLDALKGGAPSDRTSLVCDLLTNWQDGRVKQYLIYQTLNFRRQQAGLFQSGSYEPLVATGNFRENLCAFARRLEDRWLIAAVPRLIARMLTPGQPTLDAARWDDGVLLMPRHAPDVWRNVLTGERLSACTVKGRQKGLSLAQLFKTFPVALVQCE